MVREWGHSPPGWHTGGVTAWADCQREKTNAKQVGSILGRSQTPPVLSKPWKGNSKVKPMQASWQGKGRLWWIQKQQLDPRMPWLCCYSAPHLLLWCLGLPAMELSGLLSVSWKGEQGSILWATKCSMQCATVSIVIIVMLGLWVVWGTGKELE